MKPLFIFLLVLAICACTSPAPEPEMQVKYPEYAFFYSQKQYQNSRFANVCFVDGVEYTEQTDAGDSLWIAAYCRRWPDAVLVQLATLDTVKIGCK